MSTLIKPIIYGIQGASTASANDLTVPLCNQVSITGTTQINGIGTTGWLSGSVITLTFVSALCTLKHDTAPSAGFAKLYFAGLTDYISAAGDSLTFVYDGTYWRELRTQKITTNNITMNSGRLKGYQGADVASANNLSLGFDGNVFEITGTTQINLISNIGWQNGSEITLVFNAAVTVKHAQATSSTNVTILLAGASDFSATQDDILTLVLCENTAVGQAWREKSRTAI